MTEKAITILLWWMTIITEAEGNMYQQRRKIVVSVRAAQDK